MQSACRLLAGYERTLLPVAGNRKQEGSAGAHLLPCRSRLRRPSMRQMRLNTSVPLVPPKPKPFDMATSIFFSRATLGT